MSNLLGIGQYDEPHPELLIIQDMLDTLYSKSDEFQKAIQDIEKKEGLHHLVKDSMVNSYGLSSCYMDESIIKYLTISIAALYESILKEFHGKTLKLYTHIKVLKNAKGNEVRCIEKVTKHYLTELGLLSYFENDLFKNWVVLVKLRNVFTHEYYDGELLSRTIEKTKVFVSKFKMEKLIECDTKSNKIHIERDFFQDCLNDIIAVVTKLEIISDKPSHAFEIYVFDNDGYTEKDYDAISDWRKNNKV